MKRSEAEDLKRVRELFSEAVDKAFKNVKTPMDAREAFKLKLTMAGYTLKDDNRIFYKDEHVADSSDFKWKVYGEILEATVKPMTSINFVLVEFTLPSVKLTEVK